MLASQWQTAAQLFFWMMTGTCNERYASDDAATVLVEHANNIVLLTTCDRAELTSRTELLLYGHGRLLAALAADGMRQPNIDEWIVTEFGRLLQRDPVRRQVIEEAVNRLHPQSEAITERYRSAIGPARRVLKCSLQPEITRRVAVSDARLAPLLTFIGLVVFVVVTLMGASAYRNLFTFPTVSAYLDGNTARGSWLSTALVAWPFLLVVTWVFAFIESIRKRTFHYISPWHLASGGGVIAGEVMAFRRDWFFHIFQFAWIVLVVIAWLLFRDYSALPQWLNSDTVWDPAKTDKLRVITDWMAQVRGDGDVIALSIACFAFLVAIGHQVYVQRQRIRGADIYWWDRRIGRTEWAVRLLMVGLDLFLASFLIVKMVTMLFVAYSLATADGLTISFYSFDGVGGLKHLTDILMHLSWAVFLFGMFVFASLLLHWNLREYRVIDLSLVVAYVLIVAFAVGPLAILESKLASQKEQRLEELVNKNPGTKLDDAGNYVKNLALVRDWPASVLAVGILGNPVLPLGFQFIVVVIQFLIRAGKLPKLPIPGLGAGEDSKNGHAVP
jgi:hypothetical protein